MNSVIIDVREKDEYEAEHIADSIHLPLSSFDRQAPAVLKSLLGREIILICRSGKRAGLAAQQASAYSDGLRIEVYTGGILEWKNQGKPTLTPGRARLPIMRQVQLIAGSLVLVSSLCAYFLSPAFIAVAGFVGAGLTLAGSTGFCGMAELLAKMPWNRTS